MYTQTVAEIIKNSTKNKSNSIYYKGLKCLCNFETNTLTIKIV